MITDDDLNDFIEACNRQAGCGFWPLWVLTGNTDDQMIFRSLRDPAFTMMQKQLWPWFDIWQFYNRIVWQLQTGRKWWSAR